MSRALSDEFLLCAACCRWPPSQTRDDAVREAASRVRDWKKFVGIVSRQRVTAQAHAALACVGERVPADIMTEFAVRARHMAHRNLRMANEVVTLQALFDAAGIRMLTLKGATLAQQAYRSLALKHSKDIDLLIDGDHLMQAVELLQANGYGLQHPAPSLTPAQWRVLQQHDIEAAFLGTASGTQVELHWRPVANALLLTGVDANAPSQTISLAPGKDVQTLAAPELFAYLCAHGALCSWFRLKWLADVNAFLSHRSAAEVEALFDFAQSRGTGYCAGQALLMCEQLFGLSLSPSLSDKLRSRPRMARLASMAINLMTGGDEQTEVRSHPLAIARFVFSQLLLGSGWRFFLAHYRIFAVRIRDVLEFPLPEPLYFLYPILRVPLWLARTARAVVRSLISPAAKRRSAVGE